MGKFAAIGAALLPAIVPAGSTAAALTGSAFAGATAIGAVASAGAVGMVSKMIGGGIKPSGGGDNGAAAAAQAQKDVALAQIQATKDAEKDAQTTANAKLRAAQARKSQTILTGPELEEVNTNQKTALGV